MEKIDLEKTYKNRFEVIVNFLYVLKSINGIKIGDKDLNILAYLMLGYKTKNINTKEKIFKEQGIKDSGLYTALYRLREVGLVEKNEEGDNIPHADLRKLDFRDGRVLVTLYLKSEKEGDAL